MRWRDIVEQLESRPGFREAYEQQFPYANVALAVVALRERHGLTERALAGRVGTPQPVIAPGVWSSSCRDQAALADRGGGGGVLVCVIHPFARSAGCHAVGRSQPDGRDGRSSLSPPALTGQRSTVR